MGKVSRYPVIADYGMISDCHSAALVARSGSIDWLCMPRFDSGSLAGRLLDRDHGGHCSIGPVGRTASHRRYLDGTLVLETTVESGGNEARLISATRPTTTTDGSW